MPAAALIALGFKLIATRGTQRYLAEHGVTAEKVNKVPEGRPHIVDAIKNGEIQLVFNTTEGASALADCRSMRRAALLHKVPYYTTLAGAVAAAQAIEALSGATSKCAPPDLFRRQGLTPERRRPITGRYEFGQSSAVACPTEASGAIGILSGGRFEA